MPEPNYSNHNIPETQLKGKLPIAILLGLLTFVVTPIVSAVIAIPFLFLGKISESLNPTGIIARIFGLRELGGFFAAQFILIGFFALIGDFATAVISWLINHSKKLATITFCSALALQFVTVAVVVPIIVKQSQRTMKARIEFEKSFQEFAKIGNVSYEIQDQYSDGEINNRRPEYGPLYKKLKIVIPISVSRAGTYLVTAQYSFSKEGVWGNTQMKEITRIFNVGDHVVKAEFLASEAGGGHGYWSPTSVGGSAEVQLSYLVSEKEVLLDELESDSMFDKAMLKLFVKDEELNSIKAPSKSTINKFVERKKVQF